jgi:hypothetical protein
MRLPEGRLERGVIACPQAAAGAGEAVDRNGHGSKIVGGSYYLLDLTALGRQEDWEEPKDRAADARGAVPNFSA